MASTPDDEPVIRDNEMRSGSPGGPHRNLIVVGMDDSPHAREALVWALREAPYRQAPVRVVMAWGYPLVIGLDETAFAVDREAIQRNAEKVLHATVVAAVESVAREAGSSGGAPPDVPIEERAVIGSAADVLIDQSRTAALLVVGARGRGGFPGLRLGSVSSQVTHSACCPVVVVRGGSRVDPAVPGNERSASDPDPASHQP